MGDVLTKKTYKVMKKKYTVETKGEQSFVILHTCKGKHSVTGFSPYKYDTETPLQKAQKLADKLNADLSLCDPLECAETAQRIYDKINWGNATHAERIMKIAAELQYLEMTGKPIQLIYNCPA